MKIIFMGTPEFALPAFQRLIDSKHEIVLVLTQPDRPKGRGRKIEPSPVRQMAEAHGLRVLTPERLRRDAEALVAIRDAGADLAVVAAYGQILPRDVLTAPRLGCINIHPSMLPDYRGAAPIQRCLLDGNTDTGVTLIMLTDEVDAGPIVAQQPVEILPDDDAQSLGAMLATLGADMLLRVIDEAEAGGAKMIEGVPQHDEDATYAAQIKKEEGLIPWEDPTEAIMFRLRAMTPWPGVYTFIDGKKQLGIEQGEPLWSNEVEEVEEVNQEGPMNESTEDEKQVTRSEKKVKKDEVAPGTVTSLKKGFGFTVKTGSGHLLVTAVRPEGKRRMDAAEYIVGRNLLPGQKLGSPQE